MAKKRTEKKKDYEVIEEIDAMGDENEAKGAKAVIEKFDEQAKEEKKVIDNQLENLTKKRKAPKIFVYKEQLAIHLAELLREENFPKDAHWRIDITGKGISLTVFSKEKEFFQVRKFAICGEPKFDLHACVVLAYWAGDFVFEKYQKKEEKIILQ